MSLWEQLALPWQACVEESWAAYRAGSYPIGAVICGADGTIVARGRNRVFESGSNDPRAAAGHLLFGTRLAHAEINALLALDTDRHNPETCVLYSAAEPCPLCTGAIRMTKVQRVRFASTDPPAGSLALLDATPWMRKRPFDIVGPQNSTLEAALIALRVERVLRLSGGVPDHVADALSAVSPSGFGLGESLARDGRLQQLASTGAPAADLLTRLEEWLAEDDRLSASG